MKIYKMPQDLKAIFFDIDGTLYTSAEYVAEQVDIQVRHFAHIQKIPEDEMRRKIREWRRAWSKEHGGKSISLGNTLTAFGVPIEKSIEWRNTLLQPEKYLCKNQNLIDSLLELNQKYKLICITNNPVDAARKTLKAVGIEKIITDIIGLDTCMKSKPDAEMLYEASRVTGVPLANSLSVGDRYDIDLALPLDLGMGAVLVTGAEEVCLLSGKLCS